MCVATLCIVCRLVFIALIYMSFVFCTNETYQQSEVESYLFKEKVTLLVDFFLAEMYEMLVKDMKIKFVFISVFTGKK